MDNNNQNNAKNEDKQKQQANYQQPPTNYQQQSIYIQQPQKKESNGMALASFILSIFGFMTGIFIIGLLLDILSAIFGIIVLAKKKAGKGFAITGIVISSLGFLAVMSFLIPETVDVVEDISENANIENEIKNEDKYLEENIIPEIIIPSFEEFEDLIIDFDYKDILRSPQDYHGRKIIIDVDIDDIYSGGLNENDIYYQVDTDGLRFMIGDQFYAFDFREDYKDVKLLEQDRVRIYGEIVSMENGKKLLLSELFEEPYIKMYYMELIEEE